MWARDLKFKRKTKKKKMNLNIVVCILLSLIMVVKLCTARAVKTDNYRHFEDCGELQVLNSDFCAFGIAYAVCSASEVLVTFYGRKLCVYCEYFFFFFQILGSSYDVTRVFVQNCVRVPCRLPINRRVRIMTEFASSGKYIMAIIFFNMSASFR